MGILYDMWKQHRHTLATNTPVAGAAGRRTPDYAVSSAAAGREEKREAMMAEHAPQAQRKVSGKS